MIAELSQINTRQDRYKTGEADVATVGEYAAKCSLPSVPNITKVKRTIKYKSV